MNNWDEKINTQLLEVKKLRKQLADIRQEISSLYQNDNLLLDIPYVPSTSEKVDIIFSLAGDVAGKKIVDLGSGDGRILIKFAQNGASADGYELEPNRVNLSRKNIKESHLDNKISIFQQNLWNASLNKYDIIIIYGLTSIMGRLKDKIEKECTSPVTIISNRFAFPDWQPIKEKEDVYLYKLNTKIL